MVALSVEKVTKTYKNGVTALKKISLKVKEGDFFALLGPNGAGKSTLINIITSLVNKDSGRIKVFKYDLDHDLNKAKSLLGVVPQEFNFNIFETPWQIVLNQAGYYGIKKKIASQRAEKYLVQLGLWDKKDSQSMRLSGGMKRRLMIARALVNEPKLLILDEPTVGVDIKLRRSTWDYLVDLKQKGTTIILTTHYLEEAEHLCKGLAIIDKGEIITHTSVKELVKKLDTQVFILDTKETIKEIPKISGYKFNQIDDQTLEVEIKRNRSMNVVFREIDKLNFSILGMRNKSNRLEELFIKILKK